LATGLLFQTLNAKFFCFYVGTFLCFATGIVTGLIYAYIAIEQALKGNMGLACMYSGYCFANYGAYLIATK